MYLVLLLLAVSAASANPRARLYPSGRIVGGEPIEISRVNYQISLQWNGRHICGGSVISPAYVITAAHCTDDFTASELSIRAGTGLLETGGQVSAIRQILQHPLYDAWDIDWDISVLALATELVLGTNVGIVRLPDAGTTYPVGTDVLVTGWGYLSEDGDFLPNQLQGVVVQLVAQQACAAAYALLNWPVSERMLCAAVPGGGKDACQGDSGGPLVVDGVLLGLVSWGYGCARADYPGVYASVPALRDFVTNVTNIL